MKRATAAAVRLALLALLLAPAATVDAADATRSSDAVEATLGGNLTLGAAWLEPDRTSPLGLSAQEDSHSGAYLRRATVGVDGRAYGFDFTVNEDFSNINAPADGLRDVWLAHRFGAGGTVFIGQHKPWRSLDEMGGSSTMALEENNVASSNGLYGSRSYTQGLYYSWSDRHVLAGHDAVWAGASLYSNTRGSKGSGGGFGWNARLVYLPWLATGHWLHLGMSYSRDRSAAYASGDGNIGYGAPRAGYRTWYGRQSSAARVVHFGAGPAASTRTLALELAADQGPVYLQVEGGDAHLAQGGQSAHVRAWSSELAVVITGEARAYAIGKATFGAVRPSHGYGALEVALRYDRIDNFTRASCALSAAAVSTCRVSAWTAGLNYYANPHVRFMFDYQRGLADAGMAGQDRAWGLDARAQVTF